MANETFSSIWDALSDTEEQAQNMKVRSQLMRQIKASIAERGWTQTHAAQELGITQPRVSDLNRGRIHKFSLDALVTMATHIGLRVEISLVDDLAKDAPEPA